MIRIRDELNKQKQVQDANSKMINAAMMSIKSEIETIKGILLNRKQFASPPSVGIPSWQLETKKRQDDTGSAHSNSSENETEVIQEEPDKQRSPATNSDSSLEIM